MCYMGWGRGAVASKINAKCHDYSINHMTRCKNNLVAIAIVLAVSEKCCQYTEKGFKLPSSGWFLTAAHSAACGSH